MTAVAAFRSLGAYIAVSLYVAIAAPIGMALALAFNWKAHLYVLGHWGVTRTEDFGRIVFTLVEVGLLVTQPGDHEADFEAVYAFADAFGDSYEWQGVRGA